MISKDQSEQFRATADAADQAVAADKAAIESAEAAIGASQAAIEIARVQLGYTSIRSPIDGRTGNLNVKQGNVVMANTVDLMTINQVEPIYVTFAVPEAQLPAIKRYMAEGKLAVRAQPQDDPGERGDRSADVRGQRRGHDHRHHQAEGHLPQHRSQAVAGSSLCASRCG